MPTRGKRHDARYHIAPAQLFNIEQSDPRRAKAANSAIRGDACRPGGICAKNGER
jgi:hypothetical protein